MTRSYYNSLHSRINDELTILREKYDISDVDMHKFLTNIDLHPPIRKKTMLLPHEQCCARKLDGHQCSRRHKPNEQFCGKHMLNRPFGIYNGLDINVKNSIHDKTKIYSNKSKKFDDTIVLKSVKIQNKYYYMDRHKILYNPEPVNGCYEVIGKLNGVEDIFYATTFTKK